jgi:hypothetical protein
MGGQMCALHSFFDGGVLPNALKHCRMVAPHESADLNQTEQAAFVGFKHKAMTQCRMLARHVDVLEIVQGEAVLKAEDGRALPERGITSAPTRDPPSPEREVFHARLPSLRHASTSPAFAVLRASGSP